MEKARAPDLHRQHAILAAMCTARCLEGVLNRVVGQVDDSVCRSSCRAFGRRVLGPGRCEGHMTKARGWRSNGVNGGGGGRRCGWSYASSTMFMHARVT
eukprot:CAMPEP_0194535032 /NCGR_PEP_ID=MMETSP0253-20130528/73443_1 /TAXON_ID=2966 /ORGANISM="Noctiluca scintillans" /LENGTH=98 /DNA_ID=CAMNT_0039380755 /DNA_START=328 /DNA_END=620 /DNA_ORIENTATION=-